MGVSPAECDGSDCIATNQMTHYGSADDANQYYYKGSC